MIFHMKNMFIWQTPNLIVKMLIMMHLMNLMKELLEKELNKQKNSLSKLKDSFNRVLI